MFLELKPQWAQVIIGLWREEYRVPRGTSDIKDAFDILFDYGRTQAELMGGERMSYAQRFNRSDKPVQFWR